MEEVHTEGAVLTGGLTAALLIILTVLTHPARGTPAVVVSNQILALTSIPAGRGLTVIDVSLAELSAVSISTLALKPVVQVQTLQSSIGITGSSAALIILYLTCGAAREARSADTLKTISFILAGSSILARFISAVVHRVLAVLTSEARLTETSVAIVIINTLSIILTRSSSAVINVDVTVGSRPARLTHTLVPEQLVHTLSSDTGVRLTQVHLLFTSLTSETSGTSTGEVIDQVSAVGSQQTRLLQTIIDVLLTESSLPAISALTCEPTLGQGPAGGSISTGVTIL